MKHKNLFLLTLFLLACGKDNILPEENLPDLKPLSAQEMKLVEAGNDFALKITRRINDDEPGNFFISPLSVGYALGMTFNGAAGETREGIKKTLDFGNLSDDEINHSYYNLRKQLMGMDKKVEMEIANSVWFRNDLQVKNAFKGILAEYYDAVATGLNFGDPAAKDIINKWIESKTRGKIRDMLDQIPADAVMYLVNAIYFKADWTFQFDKSATKKEPFKLNNGSEKLVDMMFSKGVEVSYIVSDKFTYIEVPYGNRQFVMSVMLPNQGYTVDDVFSSLGADQLKNLSGQARKITVELKLPKFKLEYKKLLNDHLSDMGMARAFTPSAEFPDLFEDPLSLMISRVLHQSFIEVNEEGSEAAAATIVEIVETSMPINPDPQRITVDRPFAFFITERHTNSVMFSGKMMEP
jgi:serine protease inhibitor